MNAADAALSSCLAVSVGPDNIRSLILEKEKELHDINASRIRTLETILRDKETAANAAKQTYNNLLEDCKHKLTLLERRNEELALKNVNFTSLKDVLRDKETELNEVQAREKKLQMKLRRAKEQRHELKMQYQRKLRNVRVQVEGLRWKYDDKLKNQQKIMEIQRRKMEKLLREKEKKVMSQRRELTMTFDDVRRQKEVEFKRENDALLMKMRDLELKNEMMVRNADVQCVKVEELEMKNEKLEEVMQENDKEMMSLKLTVMDVESEKEAKVGELNQREVVMLIEMKQQLVGEYESKMAELFRLQSSVEKAFVQQKTQHDEELQRLLEQKQSDMQEASTRSEAKLKALAEKLRESEEKVEALQAELKHAESNADERLIVTEREIKRARSALQDLEVRAQTLQKRCQESASQIAVLKEKDMTLRQELLEGVEKKKDLQREVVALNLRWENRWQEQQELDEQHELRLRELQQGRDCLSNEKQAVEGRLLYAANEVQWLHSELLSLKASAGSTDSFDPQYLASAANFAAKMSSESAPAATSSLWSDDPGTRSSGMSLLLTESPLSQPTTDADAYASALETDSAKLRKLIRQMQESLTQQQKEMETFPDQAGVSPSDSECAAQLLEAQAHCLTLETQLDTSSTLASSIALQFEICKQELTEAQQLVETKSRQIVELESRIHDLKGMGAAESEWQSRHAALEARLADLNRKLEAASCDIDRLVRECSQLMELSNQLRADLRRRGNCAELRSSMSRVEFAGKRDYQDLIAELTQSLKELRIRNKALKKHLRRMVKLQIRLHHKRMSSCVGRDGESDTAEPEKASIRRICPGREGLAN